ncbi:hypothetical protein ALC56_07155 [Trachymyrmex septentrionalis]|uniref:CCHC-type domain-containing protein n=1 Tax=Trachymyrmex septentrionalis TaxID=34720 RepID=A0A151JW19_9HYME|nr:hypothetical protein ALC56_07155 [Trachymyrmex septentrionalis]
MYDKYFRRVEVLPERSLQCFRCLGVGHVRTAYSSETAHSDYCYHCGAPGHTARSCMAEACCLPCQDAGKRTWTIALGVRSVHSFEAELSWWCL